MTTGGSNPCEPSSCGMNCSRTILRGLGPGYLLIVLPDVRVLVAWLVCTSSDEPASQAVDIELGNWETWPKCMSSSEDCSTCVCWDSSWSGLIWTMTSKLQDGMTPGCRLVCPSLWRISLKYLKSAVLCTRVHVYMPIIRAAVSGLCSQVLNDENEPRVLCSALTLRRWLPQIIQTQMWDRPLYKSACEDRVTCCRSETRNRLRRQYSRPLQRILDHSLRHELPLMGSVILIMGPSSSARESCPALHTNPSINSVAPPKHMWASRLIFEGRPMPASGLNVDNPGTQPRRQIQLKP